MKVSGESAAEVLQFLGDLPLFDNITDCSRRLLAGGCRFIRVGRGQIVFFEADTGESAYVVRSGTISIVLNSPDGREMEIDEVRAGGMFGELELLTREPRSACAVAYTNAELLVIPGPLFLKVMEAEPALARGVLDFTACRLQKSTKRQMSLAFMNAHARLARDLLRMDKEAPDPGYITASQEDLARGAGLIRQTVAKALGEWRRNGWLLTGRGRIVILNRKALERVEKGDIGL